MLSLDELWNSAAANQTAFDPERLSYLPEPARRYLRHAIAPKTPLASVVRLRMHGSIKLRRWLPFTAEQVIRWDRGFIWRAAVRMRGLTIRGSDRWIDGSGSMRWKLFGVIPILNASGADITRSAAGRLNMESLWLPSVLLSEEFWWTGEDADNAHARFTAHGESGAFDFGIDRQGRLITVSMPRWGNPGGGEFRYASFGGYVDEEATFGGYTIPVRIRAGWNFGSPEFETEGEFFRVTVESAVWK